jgi:hypothetical protein
MKRAEAPDAGSAKRQRTLTGALRLLDEMPACTVLRDLQPVVQRKLHARVERVLAAHCAEMSGPVDGLLTTLRIGAAVERASAVSDTDNVASEPPVCLGLKRQRAFSTSVLTPHEAAHQAEEARRCSAAFHRLARRHLEDFP